MAAGVPLRILSAGEALARMGAGELTASDYARALLARVAEVEPTVQAWAFLDEPKFLAQAAAADEQRRRGAPTGPLCGVPVGVKDIIDTRDLPTENGTVLHRGRQPAHDAEVVQRLRAAGGLVMGKTVTTELATYAPGKTRNPHAPAHTPGGSSSGSAAAVAAGMVPLAIGTQTNGSVIRPASFCGVFGFKPSAGRLPRDGVLTQSPALDQLGVFGRTLDDVALLAHALAGDATHDAQPGDATPRLAWAPTPLWDRVASDAQSALRALVGRLGSTVATIELPSLVTDALAWHRTVMEADIAASFENEYEQGYDHLSASLRGQIERGRQVSAVEYRKALEKMPLVRAALDQAFDGADAVLTPAALGTAPLGLEHTGDPVMCTVWTFTGMPALSLPLLQGENGLPLGVQLVARRGDDARLLRAARWLVDQPTIRP